MFLLFPVRSTLRIDDSLQFSPPGVKQRSLPSELLENTFETKLLITDSRLFYSFCSLSLEHIVTQFFIAKLIMNFHSQNFKTVCHVFQKKSLVCLNILDVVEWEEGPINFLIPVKTSMLLIISMWASSITFNDALKIIYNRRVMCFLWPDKIFILLSSLHPVHPQSWFPWAPDALHGTRTFGILATDASRRETVGYRWVCPFEVLFLFFTESHPQGKSHMVTGG